MDNNCEVDEYGKIIDPITLDNIPDERLISFYQGNKKFCFDIESLYKYIRDEEVPVNPLTRVQLSEEIIEEINKYGEKFMQINVTIKPLNGKGFSFNIDKDRKLGEIIIEKHKRTADIQNIGKDLLLYAGKSLYSYDLNQPIEEIFTKDNITINSIYPLNMSSFKAEIYTNLYEYAVINDIIWLENIIPNKYKGHVASFDGPGVYDAQRIISLLNNNYDNIDMDLIDLLKNSKITALQAHQIEKIFNQVNFSLNSHQKLYIVHLIYSRVVDKFNLIPNRGIEGYYYADIYTPKNYRLFDNNMSYI